jgi:hypothetical protein
MANGLYGQAQGNETRNGIAVRDERYLDNDLIEGEHVVALREMAREQNWHAVEGYVAIMKIEGWAQARIDSMIRRATYGLF